MCSKVLWQAFRNGGTVKNPAWHIRVPLITFDETVKYYDPGLLLSYVEQFGKWLRLSTRIGYDICYKIHTENIEAIDNSTVRNLTVEERESCWSKERRYKFLGMSWTNYSGFSRMICKSSWSTRNWKWTMKIHMKRQIGTTPWRMLPKLMRRIRKRTQSRTWLKTKFSWWVR